MKKLALFTVMALGAAGASAQSIKVTSELIEGGKVIQQFSGSGDSGQTQSYAVGSKVPYKKAVKQIGDKIKTETGYYQTGTKMDVTPYLSSTGDIRYTVSFSRQTLLKLEPRTVGGFEIELPTGTKDSITQSVVVKPGAAREFSLGHDEATGTQQYVLKVTTSLQD